MEKKKFGDFALILLAQDDHPSTMGRIRLQGNRDVRSMSSASGTACAKTEAANCCLSLNGREARRRFPCRSLRKSVPLRSYKSHDACMNHSQLPLRQDHRALRQRNLPSSARHSQSLLQISATKRNIGSDVFPRQPSIPPFSSKPSPSSSHFD
jgi:hypothetical protein